MANLGSTLGNAAKRTAPSAPRPSASSSSRSSASSSTPQRQQTSRRSRARQDAPELGKTEEQSGVPQQQSRNIGKKLQEQEEDQGPVGTEGVPQEGEKTEEEEALERYEEREREQEARSRALEARMFSGGRSGRAARNMLDSLPSRRQPKGLPKTKQQERSERAIKQMEQRNEQMRRKAGVSSTDPRQQQERLQQSEGQQGVQQGQEKGSVQRKDGSLKAKKNAKRVKESVQGKDGRIRAKRIRGKGPRATKPGIGNIGKKATSQAGTGVAKTAANLLGGLARIGGSATAKLLVNPYVLGGIALFIIGSLLVGLVLAPAFSAPTATCTVTGDVNIPDAVSSLCSTLTTEGNAGAGPAAP